MPGTPGKYLYFVDGYMLSNLLSALVRFSHIAPKGASKMLRATGHHARMVRIYDDIRLPFGEKRKLRAARGSGITATNILSR